MRELLTHRLQSDIIPAYTKRQRAFCRWATWTANVKSMQFYCAASISQQWQSRGFNYLRFARVL